MNTLCPTHIDIYGYKLNKKYSENITFDIMMSFTNLK